MKDMPTTETLWASLRRGSRTFGPKSLGEMSEGVRRYLEHSILPGTVLAGGVRLKMSGSIKLGGWLPFTAEQVLLARGEMIWSATVRKMGMPVKGYDRLLGGEGELNWKVLGILPFMKASGKDVTLSAAGRLKAEMVWLPSAFILNGAGLSEPDPEHVQVSMQLQRGDSEMSLGIDAEGRPMTVSLKRWGNPEGKEYGYHDFGGIMEEERSFGGYTIPSRLRVGWFFGTDRFEREGEFFRATIHEAEFR